MLPLLHEYRVDHPRFREHVRIAMTMALFAPICALFFLYATGWWSKWLWACCVVGLSLALGLHCVIALHRYPPGITRLSRRLIDRSNAWFPFFFTAAQSIIAALITIFLWFSISTLALPMPLYQHVLLVILALLMPVRRLLAARNLAVGIAAYDGTRQEILRVVWHVCLTIFTTRFIMGLTVNDITDTSPESTAWRIILWVPAILYILLTLLMAIHHMIPDRPSIPVDSLEDIPPAPPPPPDRL